MHDGLWKEFWKGANTVGNCPNCHHLNSMDDHCKAPQCPWFECPGCGAVVDPRNNRYFTRDGK